MNLNKSTINRVGHTFKFSKSLLVLLVLLEMPVLSHLLSSHHQIVLVKRGTIIHLLFLQFLAAAAQVIADVGLIHQLVYFPLVYPPVSCARLGWHLAMLI